MHKFFCKQNPQSSNIKPKPSIQRISLSKESIRRLESLASSSENIPSRIDRLIKNMTGYCCLCPHMATHIAKYKIENVILIEKYCDVCIIKITQIDEK
jgi:hypothetical protein